MVLLSALFDASQGAGDLNFKECFPQQVKSQEELIKKITPDEAKLKSLRKRVEAAETEYDKACEAAKTVEDKIQKLDKKIKDIMGGKVSKDSKCISLLK